MPLLTDTISVEVIGPLPTEGKILPHLQQIYAQCPLRKVVLIPTGGMPAQWYEFHVTHADGRVLMMQLRKTGEVLYHSATTTTAWWTDEERTLIREVLQTFIDALLS